MPKLLQLCDPSEIAASRHVSYMQLGKSYCLTPAESPPDPQNASSSVWDERRLDVKLNDKALYCTEEQREAIRGIYAPGGGRIAEIFSETPASQADALTFLKDHKLDSESLEMLESRWSIASVVRWKRKGPPAVTVVRTTYQCVCGYNTASRQVGKKKRTENDVQVSKEWSRHAPYDFTSCLVHADITYIDVAPRIISRVIGWFQHNDACQKSLLVRYPAIPLHEHVIQVALRQLQRGLGLVS
ncbi:unnamed protein product [Somion occarium]|uniref:Uncharacterized protein n=1 Tax=Somion occarium TaxID=3059160 RepID=A0ABP1E6D2_9APHY